jgi:hypothetical protein
MSEIRKVKDYAQRMRMIAARVLFFVENDAPRWTLVPMEPVLVRSERGTGMP